LTISEEGGLEEVLESLRALAKRSCNSATLARSASICACWALTWARKRLQLGQVDFLAMKLHYMKRTRGGFAREWLQFFLVMMRMSREFEANNHFHWDC
jgi:hypothetical protein